ncbi:hypothetical protein [Nocardia iowensis]|uniref:Arsenate reductase n=1 Tax=Nocardia iowensis TaxID=204891 RepID=A0ABX8RWF6_NOCIO|nr:hypothetical protein [Nocardia iowensis]QXN93182.1 hypothetical protein KV110_08820 [Nocardia iowensis]
MTLIGNPADWVPDSCTLPTVEQPLRNAEFDRFFAGSVLQTRRPLRTQLELVIAPDAEPAGRDLAAREVECCSFFGFTFTSVDDAVIMRITVPEGQVDVLDALAARVEAKRHD